MVMRVLYAPNFAEINDEFPPRIATLTPRKNNHKKYNKISGTVSV